MYIYTYIYRYIINIYIYIYIINIYLYIYIYIYKNFACQVQMSKYIYKKPRHLFTEKLCFGENRNITFQ